MPEPIAWKSEFAVFKGNEPAGNLYSPEIVGLSNGNILIAWGDADGTLRDDGKLHILGRLYDATGKSLGGPFLIDRHGAGEGPFELAATGDGGFAIAFGTHSGNVLWQRHDATGARVKSETVATETATDRVGAPQLAVDHKTDTSVVGYVAREKSGDDVDSFGATISRAGTTLAGSYSLAENAGDHAERLGDVVILKNGNAISAAEVLPVGAFMEASDTSVGLLDPSNGQVFDHFDIDGRASAQLATLSNGNWVMASAPSHDFTPGFPMPKPTVVWAIGKANGDYLDGDTIDTAGDAYRPQVVALPGGGFVVAWYEGTQIMARAFDNDGTERHTDPVTITDVRRADFSMSVTGDGRVLFAWVDEEEFLVGGLTRWDYDIHASIWDPRGGTVAAGAYDNELSNFVATHTVTARPGGGVLLGTAAGDTLIGWKGADTIKGQGGNDTLLGNGAADILRGGNGRDELRGGAQADKLHGDRGNDRLFGDAGNDSLFGTAGRDVLKAGAGSDRLDGGTGRDVLFGGLGADDFVLAAKGPANADRIQDFARAADDVLLQDAVFRALNDLPGGKLKPGEFRLGTAAQDGNDHIIYHKPTGRLWYDADGKGGQAKTLIAEFDDGTTVLAGDFFVI